MCILGDSVQIDEVCNNWLDGAAIRISCKRGSIIVIRSVTVGKHDEEGYDDLHHKCQSCFLRRRFTGIWANEHYCTEKTYCFIVDYHWDWQPPTWLTSPSDQPCIMNSMSVQFQCVPQAGEYSDPYQ